MGGRGQVGVVRCGVVVLILQPRCSHYGGGWRGLHNNLQRIGAGCETVVLCVPVAVSMIGGWCCDVMCCAVLCCLSSGVFWIDWKSVCRFFDVIYTNWKPKLFEHKSTIHELVLLWWDNFITSHLCPFVVSCLSQSLPQLLLTIVAQSHKVHW